jgi:hypothetical protein
MPDKKANKKALRLVVLTILFNASTMLGYSPATKNWASCPILGDFWQGVNELIKILPKYFFFLLLGNSLTHLFDSPTA